MLSRSGMVDATVLYYFFKSPIIVLLLAHERLEGVQLSHVVYQVGKAPLKGSGISESLRQLATT